jgi:hypothetical protein
MQSLTPIGQVKVKSEEGDLSAAGDILLEAAK